MATPLEPLTVAGHSGPGDEAEAGLGTPAPRPDDAQGSGSAARTTSAALTELYTISYLVFFAIFGTLARVSLQALTSYPGTPTIFGSLWPNFAGCLVMGFLAENRKLFLHEPGTANSSAAASPPSPPDTTTHPAVKTTPLYIGLATGLCGSVTSFSSFMRDLFLALSNDLAVPGSPAPATTPRRGEYSFIALLAVLVITISSSLGALFAGAHLAAALDPYTQFQSSGFTNKVFNRAAVPLAVGCWALAVGLSVMPLDKDRDRLNNPAPTTERWRSNVSFALAFAPLGCLLRFYISGWLNKHRHAAAFPWGTFAVNFLGTAVLGAAWDLQHAPRALAGGAVVGCQVLQGVEDGFCGCLTTVSTWAVELTSLRGPRRLRDAYVYGSASVGVGLAVLVAIMGGLRWTEGFGEVQCVD